MQHFLICIYFFLSIWCIKPWDSSCLRHMSWLFFILSDRSFSMLAIVHKKSLDRATFFGIGGQCLSFFVNFDEAIIILNIHEERLEQWRNTVYFTWPVMLFPCWIFPMFFNRMDRQRREEELKNKSSKKGHEAEQAILNRVSLSLSLCACEHMRVQHMYTVLLFKLLVWSFFSLLALIFSVMYFLWYSIGN